MIADFWLVLRWWGALFLVGSAAFPLTKRLFSSWYDHGYIFSKAVGMALVGWIVYVLGTLHVLPFSFWSIVLALGVVFLAGLSIHVSMRSASMFDRRLVAVIVLEEVFFLAALTFWAFIKAHEPSIRGLEKFMDYGFMNAIFHSGYFPPQDMWYPPHAINYYYFGHLVTAMLTKLAGLDLVYTFNLMLATLFAFTLTMSFSIAKQITGALWAGLVTSYLVTLAGNMQTLYAFTRGYTGEDVKPFWELLWPLSQFWAKLPEGMSTYWYANATRFIPFSIHEFPSYSFVVSDVHGHVLSLPFVLLAIGLLFEFFSVYTHSLAQALNETKVMIRPVIRFIFPIVFYGFMVGILLMTNALDGPIYLSLFIVLLLITTRIRTPLVAKRLGIVVGIVVLAGVLASAPFLAHFESFVNGVAVNCPPQSLVNTKVGPLLFETADKCQKSPLWMMTLLWGFFWFCGASFVAGSFDMFRKKTRKISFLKSITLWWSTYVTHAEKILMIFFLFGIGLIVFPEFFYFKDIYPQHFRSNTMFKLGYDAFILFSIVSGYSLFWFVRSKLSGRLGIWRFIFLIFLLPQLFLVSIYPFFSVPSYFGKLTSYQSLYGLNWMVGQYPDDYKALLWLNTYINDAKLPRNSFAILEADGDSYTDFNRFSVFVGAANPVGWAVHEWLWRGSYDAVSPRREDVRVMYESVDIDTTNKLLDQYKVRFIIVGVQERERFPALAQSTFDGLAKVVFQSGDTYIYERVNMPVDK